MAIVSLPLPIQLLNGQIADAGQVMTDLNAIASNVNANAAKNGVNSDITALNALVSVGPGVSFTGANLTNANLSTSTITNSSLIGGTAAGLTLDSTSTVPTAPLGTNNTQIANTAFVVQQAFSTVLPSQSGNAGKFLSTNGTSASWQFTGGITQFTNVSSAVSISLTSASTKGQIVSMTALGQSVTLPDATTIPSPSAPLFMIRNGGGFPFGVRANDGGLITAISPGGEILLTLENNGTAAGVWSFVGNGVEPGLVTIDSTFSTAFTSTVVAPFVTLDNNTSIHFAQFANGFAAFAVDNTGKVFTSAVTVTATAGSVPVEAFKISATQTLLFYGPGPSANSAVVLTLSGVSPSLTLTVGTPAVLAGTFDTLWGGENVRAQPQIAQLTTNLYVAVGTTGAGASHAAVALSVSGTTVTIGTPLSFGGFGFGAFGIIIAPLTATTAFIHGKYSTGPSVQDQNSVLSVSGTTCTVGTAIGVNGFTSDGTISGSVVVCSPTKVMVSDNTDFHTAKFAAITVAGTVVTLQGSWTINNCPPISTAVTGRAVGNWWLISAGAVNLIGVWFISNPGSISQLLTLSQDNASGFFTESQNLYGSISNPTESGFVFPQVLGSTQLVAIRQEGANGSNKLRIVPHFIGANGFVPSYSAQIAGTSNSASATATSFILCRLSSGDHIMLSGSTATVDAIPVFRTNGVFINNRGNISVPAILGPISVSNTFATATNRIVVLGNTQYLGSATANNTTYQLRLLNVEIAQ